jgi:hypothetical protein
LRGDLQQALRTVRFLRGRIAAIDEQLSHRPHKDLAHGKGKGKRST